MAKEFNPIPSSAVSTAPLVEEEKNEVIVEEERSILDNYFYFYTQALNFTGR